MYPLCINSLLYMLYVFMLICALKVMPSIDIILNVINKGGIIVYLYRVVNVRKCLNKQYPIMLFLSCTEQFCHSMDDAQQFYVSMTQSEKYKHNNKEEINNNSHQKVNNGFVHCYCWKIVYTVVTAFTCEHLSLIPRRQIVLHIINIMYFWMMGGLFQQKIIPLLVVTATFKNGFVHISVFAHGSIFHFLYLKMGEDMIILVYTSNTCCVY